MRPTSGEENGLSPEQKRSLLAELIGDGRQDIRHCPLSLAQQRLWFLELLQPNTAAYQISSGLRLIGDLNLPALRFAVANIIERHETLRSAFVTLAGKAYQRVSPSAEAEITIVDLQMLPDNLREQEAYTVACAEARRPFDLQASPLLRLKLIRLRSNDQILLFTMHHLVSDGWSIGVFVEEVKELYESRLEGRECRLPRITVQYTDYTRWQLELLSGTELERQVRYWKTNLAGIPSLLDLPADRVRPAEQSFNCGVHSVPLPAVAIERLRSFAQQNKTTLFTVLLTALNVLLHRYSNQDCVCVGVPVAGRSHVETESLIGLFVNTLVIRTDVSGNPRFRDLLAQVRVASLEADANQLLPFEKVVEEVQPIRSLTYNPLFQVMMTAVKDPLRDQRFGSSTAIPYTLANSSSSLDLTAFLIETADGTLWWRFDYNTALFDWARIQRMSGHYQRLLQSIMENPEQRIGNLTLLTSQELEQFSEWESNAAEYPHTCVHKLIADQSSCSPNRVAVVFEDTQLTYAELDRRGRQVASALSAAGARPGSRIAILLDRSPEMIIGLLGILQTGAAYVPLDPGQPEDRLSFILKDAGADLILTQGRLASRFELNSCRQVLIEDSSRMAPYVPMEPQDPESLAYVMFTSGSTGRPKGVAVSHRALVNLLSSMQRVPGFAPDDRLLAVTNLSFDIAALELFGPLVTGARVVIAAKEDLSDGSRLLENIRRHGITCMQATPSTWRMLIDAGWSRADCKLKVLCGGEALPADLADELTERSDSVWNLYGPTETTVWSSSSRVRAARQVTIGRPIQNTRLYVLDRRMQRVPVGIPGELYIGGDGLAAGYLNRPELNRERFVASPFEADGGRLFRTGDEVRYRADGEIEYLGRLDLQVKIRGLRIELGEVEATVEAHGGIRQAVAIVREDTPGDKRLVCYAVREHGANVTVPELRAALRGKLPDYMVPMLVLLDSLPLTSNGKIDRARLPAPSDDWRGGEKPRDTVEKRLLKIWKRVLRSDGIGIRDNFFDLGGHSLLAMQLLTEVESVFDRRLPVATVFGAQTVEQMAAVLRQRPAKAASALVAIRTQGSLPPLFVIPLADGNVLPYADLARFLGSDQPVYVLQYLGVEGNEPPMERIEAIAEHFIAEVRKVQPRGPYQLVGFCVGGVVAFEMAQQLVANGEEAPLLTLVDTWHPSSIPPLQRVPGILGALRFLVHGVGRHLGATMKLAPREALRYLRQKSAIIEEMILNRDVYRGVGYKRYGRLVLEANYRAGSRYIPAPFAGRVLLILTDNQSIEADTDTRLAWRELASEGSVVFRSAADDTTELLKATHAKSLADDLAERMRQSQTRTAGSIPGEN